MEFLSRYPNNPLVDTVGVKGLAQAGADKKVLKAED